MRVPCSRPLSGSSSAANRFSSSRPSGRRLLGGVVGAAVVAVVYSRYLRNGDVVRVQAFSPKKFKDETEKAVKLTARERRFIKFSSTEFDGQLYMTPQDFLDSVVEQEPRREFSLNMYFEKANFNIMIAFPARLKRKLLTEQDVQQIGAAVPALKKGSPQMFRNLRDKGIISYTEYLFLLSILTSNSNQPSSFYLKILNVFIHHSPEPKCGFQIAFNMFDTDGNQRVDKNEFLVVSLTAFSCLLNRFFFSHKLLQALCVVFVRYMDRVGINNVPA